MPQSDHPPDFRGDRDGGPEREPRPVDHWILPFFTDSTLWPVGIAIGLALVSFGAAILVMAFQGRSLFAAAALLVLAVASVDGALADLRRRRLGLASGCILGLWLLSAMTAFAALRLGLF